MPDFLSTNHGTVISLRPVTDAGTAWAVENIALDADLEPVIHVEARMFLDTATALLEAGLSLMDSDTGIMAALPATVH